jgi:hypothetical protein
MTRDTKPTYINRSHQSATSHRSMLVEGHKAGMVPAMWVPVAENIETEFGHNQQWAGLNVLNLARTCRRHRNHSAYTGCRAAQI